LSAKVQDKNHVIVLEAATATPAGSAEEPLFRVRAFKNSHEAYNPPTALPHLTLKLHPRDGRGAVLGGLYADFRTPVNKKSEPEQVLDGLKQVRREIPLIHQEEGDSVLRAVRRLRELCPFLGPEVALGYVRLVEATSI
jgi:hypothetical protein